MHVEVRYRVGAEHAGRGLAGYSALQAGRRAARGKKITVCRGGSREWRAFMTMEGSMGAPASLANSWKKPGILGCGACLCSLPGDRHQDFKALLNACYIYGWLLTELLVSMASCLSWVR